MRCFSVLLCACLLSMAPLFAQGSSDDSGRVGVGAKVSLLGVGVEGAARVTHYTNVRAGFNVLGYSRTFNKDQVSYGGHLEFQTFEAHFDYFPWAKAFHVSGGLLAYVRTPQVTASALVPANQSFTLNSVTYYSDPTNLSRPNATMSFNSVSPTLTTGWGNLVHRDSKHFSVPFEVGVAFQGSPKTALAIGGNVCTAPGSGCLPGSDPSVQANIVGEQNKINNSLKVFKFYPIISVGFGYTF